MTIGLSCTEFDSYLTSRPSRVVDRSGDITECMDYTFGAIAGVTQAARGVFELHGKGTPKGVRDTENRCNDARGLIGVFRSFTAIENLLTFKWLYSRDDNGKIERRKECLSIASSISLIAARILSLVHKLHEWTVVNLRHHLGRIGHAITGLFTGVVIVGLITSIRDFRNSPKGKGIDLIQNVTYTVMHPFECGIGMAGPPPLVIAAGVISAIGSLVIIGTKIYESKSHIIQKA